DLSKAYLELGKKLSASKEGGDKAAPEDTAGDKTVEQQAVDAGFDLAELSKQIIANGNKLSDEILEKLAKKGIPSEAVSVYVAGAVARSAQIVAEITSVAGSEEQLKAALKWAAANLTPDEIKAYDAIMDRNDPAASKIAFTGIFARY